MGEEGAMNQPAFKAEMAEQYARTGTLIASVIVRLFNGESVSTIETEPLEALQHWIEVELRERDQRPDYSAEPF